MNSRNKCLLLLKLLKVLFMKLAWRKEKRWNLVKHQPPFASTADNKVIVLRNVNKKIQRELMKNARMVNAQIQLKKFQRKKNL